MDKELIKAMRNAIKQDDLAAVKQLLKENPDLLEAQTPFGTWLHEAAILKQTHFFQQSTTIILMWQNI